MEIPRRWLRDWEVSGLCHHRGGPLGSGVGQGSFRDIGALTSYVISQTKKRRIPPLSHPVLLWG